MKRVIFYSVLIVVACSVIGVLYIQFSGLQEALKRDRIIKNQKQMGDMVRAEYQKNPALLTPGKHLVRGELTYVVFAERLLNSDTLLTIFPASALTNDNISTDAVPKIKTMLYDPTNGTQSKGIVAAILYFSSRNKKMGKFGDAHRCPY